MIRRKTTAVTICIVLLTLVLTVLYNNYVVRKSNIEQIPTITTKDMKLISSTFEQDKLIPSEFTCDGAGTNPALSWSDVPDKALSLALIMDDPDVPTSIKPDGMFVHWVVFNIDPSAQGIPLAVSARSTLEGTQGSNGAGSQGYIGPCPPDREHRYFFKLYALDQKLNLPAGASKTDVEEKMTGHILETAELMGRYDRISRQK